MINLIEDACTAGARLAKACELVGLSSRTAQRYHRGGQITPDGRIAAAAGRTPANKLSYEERGEILADAGYYLASESTFYRILHEEKQLTHRGRAKAPQNNRPAPVEASAPNQTWSWDITYLKTTVKRIYFYLYLIMDVYSRKIVGWEVYAEESADHAGHVFRKAHMREGVGSKFLVLHSDNGSPMKGATMLRTLQNLGVTPSFSRPSVSNDNPYSESLFKTLKYRPCFPEKPFDTLDEARIWVTGFQRWYNEEHRHSAIEFVTPGQRHRGEDIAILTQRKTLYEEAKAARPERWSGKSRDWGYLKLASLNPQKST